MPRDYIRRLFASWRADTGLVASPPIGCRPQGIWAELECAFLNTYQARWQYVADALGFGFAQGKTMLWRRADLERAGGIEALAKRSRRRRRLDQNGARRRSQGAAGRPAVPPAARLIARAAEVWNRQLRWARLRRASFLAYFLPEALSGGVLPMIALAIVAPGARSAADAERRGARRALVWREMLLAAVAGWHLSALYPLYCLARDLPCPCSSSKRLRGDDFVWRGNEMQVERMRPRGMMALVRPRLDRACSGRAPTACARCAPGCRNPNPARQ